MQLHVAWSRGNERNANYPRTFTVSDLDSLRQAVQCDHIAASMRNDRRSNENFISADCIMLDLDNTHSSDPAEWKTLEDIEETFPDVSFYAIRSRNYMKPKKKTDRKTGQEVFEEPREKYHLYFPLSGTADYEQYKKIILSAAGLFPYFDAAAVDGAHFFYGVEDPQGEYIEGDQNIDEYLQTVPAEQIRQSITEYAQQIECGTDDLQKTLKKLYEFFEIRQPATKTETQPETLPGSLDWIAEAEKQARIEWLEKWAADHDIELGTRYEMNTLNHPEATAICVSCPWEDEHSGGEWPENESVIIVDITGKLSFLCRHSHGYRYGWKEYRAKVEAAHPSKSAQAIEAGWTEHREITAEQQERYKAAAEAVTQAAADQTPSTAAISAEEWAEKGYYAAEITADPGRADKAQTVTAIGYEEYRRNVEKVETAKGWKITKQHFLLETDYFPGLLTYDAAVEIFQKADETHIELKSFPELSKMAKIHTHDSVVLAADTGAGKSSLAINFLNDLNDDYPVLYFNLEMDGLTILRRLVAIRTGIELDQIEGYQQDEKTAETVNAALKAITSRKPLQVLQNVYSVEDIENTIKQATEGRTAPTIVIVDHSLLVTTKTKTRSRYERFTLISEELRRISRQQNIIMFVLLQQSREGKKDENEPPKNDSLKESGSWENDATHICFLWYDPANRRKKLLLTKNRGGSAGEVTLDYYPRTQTYRETRQKPGSGLVVDLPKRKKTKRDKKREQLETAYQEALRTTNGQPTLRDIAEAADVTTKTIMAWAREYGGIIINGQQIDPAGISDSVEYTGFVRLSESEDADRLEAFGEDQPADKPVRRRL